MSQSVRSTGRRRGVRDTFVPIARGRARPRRGCSCIAHHRVPDVGPCPFGDEYGVEDPPTDPVATRASLEHYRRPGAALLLAVRDGKSVGVGAVRGLDGRVAEIKRMYVAPEARGLHIGSVMLDALMEEARAARSEVVRLDTAGFMTDAHRLYRSRGFVERSPYEGSEIPLRLQDL